MAEQSSWNWGVRQGVRVAGALLMWQIGQRMPKKYNITGEQQRQQHLTHAPEPDGKDCSVHGQACDAASACVGHVCLAVCQHSVACLSRRQQLHSIPVCRRHTPDLPVHAVPCHAVLCCAGDLREALYADANKFIAAVGSQPFMGGAKPNLADLAMFGVLSAIRGTDTYNDLVLNSNIGQWLSRMAQTVGDSAEVKHV